ncbi:MAG TPA: hypothetical protein VKJ00_15025 [Thermoanaerobaculia bacterium]|nr:hypothetical protein [Thermoanaerobaculia bacterium]HMF10449.1 hypothetical protein [Thermoanaerobaculia bacterium]
MSSPDHRARVLEYRRRRRQPRTPEERLRFATRAIILVGLAAAVIIYITAGPPPQNPLGYDPLQTKAYRHELEVFGGKANLLVAEFQDWFAGLWQGRQLAYTVAVLSLLAAWLFQLTVRLIQAGPEDDEAAQGKEPPGTA